MDRLSLLAMAFFTGLGLLSTVFAIVAAVTGRKMPPEPDTAVPAGVPARLAAFATDVFIVLILWCLLIGLGVMVEVFRLWHGWPMLIAYYAILVLPLLYFTMPYFFGRQTPGKRWAGIALEHEYGIPISGGQALWRAFLSLMFLVGCAPLLPVDVLVAAVRSNKTSMRDLLAGTWVRQVRAPHRTFALAPLTTALVFVALFFGVIRPFCMQPFDIKMNYVPTSGMEPTLQYPDLFCANMLYYRVQPLRRGDIVVFYLPDIVWLGDGPTYSHDFFVRRVVGLPGDRLQFRRDSGVFVNGKRVPSLPAPARNWPEAGGLYTVPAGQCFVISDRGSFDSRGWQKYRAAGAGPGLPIRNIRGRASVIFLPPHHIKPL
jgi:signal peptidase I